MTMIALDTSSGEATCRWCAGRKLTEDIFAVAALACIAQPKPTRDRFGLLESRQRWTRSLTAYGGETDLKA